MESAALCGFLVSQQMARRSQKNKYERKALILPFQRTFSEDRDISFSYDRDKVTAQPESTTESTVRASHPAYT